MKTSLKLLATSCLTLTGTMALSDGHMASEMTIVSWGGAYSASQQAAYHDPYMEKTGVKIINDESSAEAYRGYRRGRSEFQYAVASDWSESDPTEPYRMGECHGEYYRWQ